MTASPTAGGVRALRAAVLAGATLALAAAAHVLAGGAVPGALGLVLPVGPLAVASVLVTRHRLSRVAILAWLGLAEAALHAYFGAAAQSSAVSALGGHGHGAADAGLALPGSAGLDPLLLSAETASPGHSSTTMLLAHACATILTGLALGHGEHVLWLVWQLLRPALLGDPAPLTICLGTVATAPPAQLRPSTFHRSPHPRGPPSARHAVR